MAQCTSKRCHKVRASIDHFVRCYGPRRTVSPIERYAIDCDQYKGANSLLAVTPASKSGVYYVITLNHVARLLRAIVSFLNAIIYEEK